MARVTATGRYTALRSPLDLPYTCQLWADTTDLTTITKDGSNFVSQHADKSGLDHHLTQTLTARPTYSAGSTIGVPSISLDGVNDYLQSTFTLSQPWSFAMAMRINTVGVGASNDVVLDGKNSVSGAVVINTPASTGPLQINAGANVVVVKQNVDWAAIRKSYGVMWVVFNGANMIAGWNERQLGGGNAGSSAPGGITIGTLGAGTAGRCCAMEYTQIAVYSAALTIYDMRALTRLFLGQ